MFKQNRYQGWDSLLRRKSTAESKFLSVSIKSIKLLGQRGQSCVCFFALLVLCIGLAANPAQAQTRAYVTNFGSNTVSVIDTSTNTVVATVLVGPRSLGVTITPNGAFAYVTNISSNDVSVINTATNTVVATVPVGINPIGVAITPAAPVGFTIEGLIQMVQNLNLKQGIENSLDAKLENARDALEAANNGDLNAACNLLDAFINQVNAQSGNALTVEQANQLRASAQQIKTTLGCQ
jgi:YVTN family beta-propeller protein